MLPDIINYPILNNVLVKGHNVLVKGHNVFVKGHNVLVKGHNEMATNNLSLNFQKMWSWA